MLQPEDIKQIEGLIKMESVNNFDKRIGDTPTDDLQLVPRKYVNLNGTLALRPASVLAIVGQQYFDTTNNRPMFYDGTKWRDGVGSVIASN